MLPPIRPCPIPRAPNRHGLRWQPRFTEPLRLEEGGVVLFENPGIGLDLDRKALDRFKA
jgi:L-alanine-DL-glutamate epimerase-like enolase superfamily enzyme